GVSATIVLVSLSGRVISVVTSAGQSSFARVASAWPSDVEGALPAHGDGDRGAMPGPRRDALARDVPDCDHADS
ncbi:MAG TPA: hypothetical protein VH165_25330, partial [Kofleriaceae bacterium]|nr:hypothetical protein [Kofleriaceae bacterium]